MSITRFMLLFLIPFASSAGLAAHAFYLFATTTKSDLDQVKGSLEAMISNSSSYRLTYPGLLNTDHPATLINALYSFTLAVIYYTLIVILAWRTWHHLQEAFKLTNNAKTKAL